jgi:hypothetical protein
MSSEKGMGTTAAREGSRIAELRYVGHTSTSSMTCELPTTLGFAELDFRKLVKLQQRKRFQIQRVVEILPPVDSWDPNRV